MKNPEESNVNAAPLVPVINANDFPALVPIDIFGVTLPAHLLKLNVFAQFTTTNAWRGLVIPTPTLPLFNMVNLSVFESVVKK